MKLQVLADLADPLPDSVLFDISYNNGKLLTVKTDASFSSVITLNEFNDGLAFVKARVYFQNTFTTLGSLYTTAGIPIIIDRKTNYNPERFESREINGRKGLEKYFSNSAKYYFTGNNNTISYSSCWDFDSLYFKIRVDDKHLNYTEPIKEDFYRKSGYLRVLWASDCIEVGLDLHHDRSEWKGRDDHEIIADVRGNHIGYQWCIQDSLYNYWGTESTVKVICDGSINNNFDADSGYNIYYALSWKELGYTPRAGAVIGFDIQDYDKDGGADEAFRSSLSGTNPESNDNTSEWASLVLVSDKSGHWLYWVFIGGGALLAGFLYWLLIWKHKRKITTLASAVINPPQQKDYSHTVQMAIEFIYQNYSNTELSRLAIARHVKLTDKYLSSVFAKETGVNLVHFINTFRIGKSIELLKNTNLSVAEIAFKVGYNSIQNFNKNFKAITGKTPGNIR